VPVRQQWKLEDVKARWQRRSLVETPTAVDAEDPIGDERGVVTVEQGHPMLLGCLPSSRAEPHPTWQYVNLH